MALPPIRPSIGDTSWFVHDRFGMFVHWGLYAMPARHEWIKSRERIPEAKYDEYFKRFDPDLYNPKEWAAMARKAGMKYAVLTSKHHEGFCMWDTQQTDYNVMNTPAGRDLLGEFVSAFRAEGLRVGFYYSLLDWHHPDFTIDIFHPRRDDPDAQAQNQGRDMKRYAAYMREQVKELLTNYGTIDILWFDFSYPDRTPPSGQEWMRGKGKDDWESEALIATARAINPKIIIDNRADIEQDIWTPEQYTPNKWLTHPKTGERLVWEACQTFSGSWGYHRDEQTWRTPKMLIEALISSVSCGGNLLMNAGPTARGELDYRAVAALNAYADWMRVHGRSIYGCTMSEFTPPSCARYTQNGDKLYLHLFDYPGGEIVLPGLAGKIAYAQFLNDASEVAIVEGTASEFANTLGHGEVMLRLPAMQPGVLIPVIELFLR